MPSLEDAWERVIYEITLGDGAWEAAVREAMLACLDEVDELGVQSMKQLRGKLGPMSFSLLIDGVREQINALGIPQEKEEG